jgi:hypothetical protein
MPKQPSEHTSLSHVQQNANDDARDAELAALRAENAALKARNGGPGISFKITQGGVDEKTGKTKSTGALSVYGLGRFPDTKYKSQWRKLNSVMPQIMAFIEAHEDELPDKV